MRLIKTYRAFNQWYKRIYRHKYKVNIGIQPKIPYFTKLKYNILGFTDEDYYNFRLDKNDYHNYISYKERWRLEYLNGRYGSYLGDKVLFERLFGNYVNVPTIFCWLHCGRFIDINTGDDRDILAILNKEKSLIAKPAKSVGGGTGVYLLEYSDKDYYVNGQVVSEDDLLTLLLKLENYIFVKRIISADYAHKIYPDSTNSIRIVSTIDPLGKVDFLLSFHRFGNSKSKPVDNLSSGGYFALVDLDSGVLSSARTITEPDTVFSKHPDTGSQIEGVQIPEWENILAILEKAHKCFPFFTFFAWDVVLNDRNEPWILEINRGTDLDEQIIKPMRHEKIGLFMREHNLLDKW